MNRTNEWNFEILQFEFSFQLISRVSNHRDNGENWMRQQIAVVFETIARGSVQRRGDRFQEYEKF